ncbi:hypothetical protein GCM10010912_17390 [Paenibacillus albidus]|uniref:Uncharacterized protein n=1 Tax=Paenibacillus albidus TaxID=2041023 RepID=A0A917FG60_9BACL|nr:hypothetical protein [Paenibacillus albidus]GGF72709.1 hypothetical protein GCM10010912_17390 [Paenibacillus albidus]
MLEHEFLLDDTLEIMAQNNKKHFSPHFVCAQSGIADIKAVTEYLYSQVGRKLKVYYEVECPDGDSDFAVVSPDLVSDDWKVCSICGIDYIPDPDRVWVAFDFLPPYIDHVKKKSIKVCLLPN